MNSPKWILCITVLLLAAGVKAQDKIHETDGEIINAKVKSVGTSTVTYVRFENQDGPEYTVDKSDVSEIIYENGSKDVFENTERRYPHPPMPPTPFSRYKNAKIDYAPNVLAIAPFQCTENGIGTSLTYERTIDKAGYISFYLPVIATYNITGEYDNNNTKPNSMYYIMPGIKIYPSTNQGRAKYAFGTSLVLGSGKVYNPQNINYFVLPGATRKEVGIMFNNSINTSPTPHFFLGTELGLGGTYIDKVNGVEQGSRFLIQFAFRMGYRF